MSSGPTMNARLGIAEGDRVHVRNPDPKALSVLKWDLHDSCELIESDDYPYPPIDVSLLWLQDGDDLGELFAAMRERVPEEGHLWAVIRAKKHQEAGRTTTVDDVAEAAKKAGLKVEEGAVVNLSDEDRAIRLVTDGAAKKGGKKKGGSKGSSRKGASKGKGKKGGGKKRSRKGSKKPSKPSKKGSKKGSSKGA